jgi:hypothetical protein
MNIRPLDPEDRGYALNSWRESHKTSPGVDRLPWSYYRHEWGEKFRAIINDASTRLLGAYTHDNQLAGWLAMTPGKRVNTLHWVYVKWKLDGKLLRRRGIMMELLAAAELGRKFAYTLHARRDRAKLPDGSTTKSLDETLVHVLRAEGISATFISLKEFLQ